LVLLAELELMAFGTGDGIFDGSQLRTGEVEPVLCNKNSELHL